MNILIVEDDEAIANLLYMDLSDEDYRCSIACDGKTAADMLEEHADYDLVLLDIMLPGIDGIYQTDGNTGHFFDGEKCCGRSDQRLKNGS